MVQLFSNPNVQNTEEQRTQRRWTVDEYHRMIAAGILGKGNAGYSRTEHQEYRRVERVELIDGYIFEMVPQEPPHASTTSSFGNEFVMLFAKKAWVRQQLPLTITPSSEPEPDISVVKIDQNRYRDRHPTPEDVYLLIEVADSTLRFDRDRKAKLYAQANIPEYWVIDVKKRQVLVMRDPNGGEYQSQSILDISDTISPVAFPDIVIPLSEFWA